MLKKEWKQTTASDVVVAMQKDQFQSSPCFMQKDRCFFWVYHFWHFFNLPLKVLAQAGTLFYLWLQLRFDFTKFTFCLVVFDAFSVVQFHEVPFLQQRRSRWNATFIDWVGLESHFFRKRSYSQKGLPLSISGFFRTNGSDLNSVFMRTKRGIASYPSVQFELQVLHSSVVLFTIPPEIFHSQLHQLKLLDQTFFPAFGFTEVPFYSFTLHGIAVCSRHFKRGQISGCQLHPHEFLDQCSKYRIWWDEVGVRQVVLRPTDNEKQGNLKTHVKILSHLTTYFQINPHVFLPYPLDCCELLSLAWLEAMSWHFLAPRIVVMEVSQVNHLSSMNAEPLASVQSSLLKTSP